MHFDLITAIGLIGGAFYLASHYMRRMVPLRALSLCSNVLFIIYARLSPAGSTGPSWPCCPSSC